MRLQVLRAAKLASMGELAAGVGHEINNPLAVIQGNLELARAILNKEGSMNKAISRLFENQSKSVARIKIIVDGLKKFAREDSESQMAFDCHTVIRETIDLIGNMYLNLGISISSDLSAQNATVQGNIGKFQQALMNLL